MDGTNVKIQTLIYLFKLGLWTFLFITARLLQICEIHKISYSDNYGVWIMYIKWASHILYKTKHMERFWIFIWNVSWFGTGAFTVVQSLCIVWFLYKKTDFDLWMLKLTFW